jgi:hypothetical protein
MNNNERYINPKEIQFLKKSIEIYKKRLITKVKASGIYENFGQKEVSQLKDKFSNSLNYMDMNQKQSIIQEFDNWCMNYTGK